MPRFDLKAVEKQLEEGPSFTDEELAERIRWFRRVGDDLPNGPMYSFARKEARRIANLLEEHRDAQRE